MCVSANPSLATRIAFSIVLDSAALFIYMSLEGRLVDTPSCAMTDRPLDITMIASFDYMLGIGACGL